MLKLASTIVLATVAVSVSANCEDYATYSTTKHEPLSNGPQRLSTARPPRDCRTFSSQVIDTQIREVSTKIKDPDLARLYENCFPNTLDTTIKFQKSDGPGKEQAFVVTGDLDAMWLRDSAQQLHPYRQFISKDPHVAALFRGVINTQIEYLIKFPYCNAFQPPVAAQAAGIKPTVNPWSKDDIVVPKYDNTTVFECKYELDSLANFFQLSSDYFEESTDPLFFDGNGWLKAVNKVLEVLENEAKPTFLADGSVDETLYQFQRSDTSATETFNNKGHGNPVKPFQDGTLLRSGFRPSDDATVFQYLIPSNAFMSVMLSKAADIASSLIVGKETTLHMQNLSRAIHRGVTQHGIVHHPVFGQVFAYEVDGYGSNLLMDDANYPNLLGLPLMGFLATHDAIYQNTRRMILSRQGNPYFFQGKRFKGVGSPHTGLGRAWPLSLLTAIQTSSDKVEAQDFLSYVLNSTAGLGLMHESVNVNNVTDYSRSWFSWANGVLGSTVLDVLERFPGLID